jgi:hypothetical protein
MDSTPRPPPFAKRRFGANLLEVKVDHEVELTQADAVAIHARMDELFGSLPIAARVEKTNHYSYSFEAMQRILLHPGLFALADHLAGGAQRPAVNALLMVTASKRRYPIEVFTSLREALEWLQGQAAAVAAPAPPPPRRRGPL